MITVEERTEYVSRAIDFLKVHDVGTIRDALLHDFENDIEAVDSILAEAGAPVDIEDGVGLFATAEDIAAEEIVQAAPVEPVAQVATNDSSEQAVPASEPTEAPVAAVAPIIDGRPAPLSKVIAKKNIDQGSYVIFFPRGQKGTKESGWQNEATRDMAVVERKTANNPYMNVGLVGKPDGNWYFDDDVNILAEYEAQHGKIQTRRNRSVSGGTHLILKQNGLSRAMGNIAGKDENGEETWSARVYNKYIVAAGSSAHPNNDLSLPQKFYENTDDLEPIEATTHFIEFLKAKAGSKPKTTSAALVECKKIAHGGIHNYLLTQAGKLRRMNVPAETLESTLIALAYENCELPLDDEKIKAMARSILSYPAGTPVVEIPMDAATTSSEDTQITVVDDPSDNDERFEMSGETFNTKVYEDMAKRFTPYPDPGENDLVSLLAKKLVTGTNIPLAFVREPLKAIVLHALDGKLRHPAHTKMSLRGNYFNLSESEGGKTTGLEWALEWGDLILKHAVIHPENLFRYKSETTFIRSFTTEGTQKRDAQGNVKSGRPGNSSQFLYIKEGNLVANCSDYFGAVFSQLTNLYDQTEAGTESMTNGDFSAGVVKASTVMCFTPSDYKATFGGKGTIGGGGLNRWGLTNPPEDHSYDDRDWERLDALIFQEISMQAAVRVTELLKGGSVILTEEPGAAKIRLEVKSMLRKVGKVGKRLLDYFMREQVVQAAMDLDGGLIMTTKQAEYIKLWVEAQLQCRLNCWPSDSANQIETMEHAIRKAVDSHFVSEKMLKDVCHYYREGSGGWFVFGAALKNSRASDAIKLTGKTRKGTRAYCPGSCSIHVAIKEDDDKPKKK